MKKRTLAIGDVHGCLNALEALANVVGFTKDDRLVFLGDYVDRGPDSKGVLDFLISLEKEGFDVTCLRGNHEIMMEEAKNRGSETRMSWIRFGGDATLESYSASTFDDIPADHWNFLKNLKPFHETENHIYVHAGVIPDTEMKDQPDYQLYWEFFDFPAPHLSGKKVICGHSSQKNGRPLSVGHAICIDTYVYGERGWLTCLEVNSEICWRANQQGETRENALEEIANEENSW